MNHLTKKKMKRLIYKPGSILVTALLLSAGTLFSQEVSKEYHKEFSAGPNTTLDVSNRYGDVFIETWDQNQIVIDVKVTVVLPSRERAEKLMSYIDVIFEQKGDIVSAKTVIDERFTYSGWGSPSRRFSIDYKIRMPEKNNLVLANRYGNTDIADIAGLVKIDIKYGNLVADNLKRGDEKPVNTLNLSYGKAEIKSAGWLDITSRYSGGLDVYKSQAVLLDSRYSKIRFGEVSSLVADTKYDNIRIDKINNLVINGGYDDIVVGTLNRKLKFEGSYGSFTAEFIPKGFESIEIDTRYIGVRLGIDSSASYELNARLSYGSLKYDESSLRVKNRIIQNTSTEISGIIGNENAPLSRVNISSSYGTIRLN